MATNFTSGAGASNVAPATLRPTPDKYVALGDLLNDYSKPDNRDLLIETYGDQGITGFLTLTGAVNSAGVQDEVTWWEEGRLHKTLAFDAIASGAGAQDITVDSYTNGTNNPVRLNDVLMTPSGEILVVTDLSSSATAVGVKAMDGGSIAGEASAGVCAIIGNIYEQGSAQPTQFYEPDVQKMVNPYIITKETYAVNGSQATNIGWVNVNGDYRWYVKGENDTRKRFMNQREMMLLYGRLAGSVVDPASGGSIDLATNAGTVTGSEGYFQAVENRGLVASVSGGAQGSFASMSDIDKIILELDKEGAPAEYAMYVNRATSLDIDDMLANGIATQVTAGLPGQFGAFNNDADMAVKLGFKSFTRGGYTFHKHDWKLLNDPNLGAIGDVKGAMVPLRTVADAKTGAKAPALQMNYKGTNGYNRDMEHWVRGSIMGYNNMSEDVAEFYYRSECNLCVRAANQHVVLK